MKIKNICWNILILLVTLVLLQSCGGAEPIGKCTPVILEIRGCEYDNSDNYHYKVTIPSSGGRFIVNGAKDEVCARICQIFDPSTNKYFFPKRDDTGHESFYWHDLEEDSEKIADEWWNIEYILEVKPYEMVIDIDSNPSLKTRSIKLDYGLSGTHSSVLEIVQKGIG